MDQSGLGGCQKNVTYLTALRLQLPRSTTFYTAEHQHDNDDNHFVVGFNTVICKKPIHFHHCGVLGRQNLLNLFSNVNLVYNILNSWTLLWESWWAEVRRALGDWRCLKHKYLFRFNIEETSECNHMLQMISAVRPPHLRLPYKKGKFNPLRSSCFGQHTVANITP